MNTHRVTVLAVDGVLPIDLGIPAQIFKSRPNTPPSPRLDDLDQRPPAGDWW